MDTGKIYDIVGIGIGPFNLGLAALTDNVPDLECLFIDKNTSFNWHPGLMLPTAKMQVPFYADLVTPADPTSRYSYMNYLKQTGKLFRFAVNESYFPLRSEYNTYCRWVVSQLNNLHFGFDCKHIGYDRKQQLYYVSAMNLSTAKMSVINAKHLVLGVGSQPWRPPCVKEIRHPNIFHSGEYLARKDVALMHRDITIIGSGQSAAEIFQDLLPHMKNLESLKWYTRSDRFYAMDYSKFSLEMSSPEYIQHFFGLPPHRKPGILARQHDLYKGINFSLIEQIYEQLSALSLDGRHPLPVLKTNCELLQVEAGGVNQFTMTFGHRETEKTLSEKTEVVILATGYHHPVPAFVEGIRSVIKWDEEGHYRVARDYSVDDRRTIFVQNAERHTHGFNSADLGLGPHRNSVIVNAIRKKRIYEISGAKNFQHF